MVLSGTLAHHTEPDHPEAILRSSTANRILVEPSLRSGATGSESELHLAAEGLDANGKDVHED